MRMRSLLGILAIGGIAAYMHKKRGGEFTVASFKESAKKVMRSLGLDKLLLGTEGKPGSAPGPSVRHGKVRPEPGESGYRGRDGGTGR